VRAILYFNGRGAAGLTRAWVASAIGLVFWVSIGLLVTTWYDRKLLYRMPADLMRYIDRAVADYRRDQAACATDPQHNRRPKTETQPRSLEAFLPSAAVAHRQPERPGHGARARRSPSSTRPTRPASTIRRHCHDRNDRPARHPVGLTGPQLGDHIEGLHARVAEVLGAMTGATAVHLVRWSAEQEN
jgi:hypothetical protein